MVYWFGNCYILAIQYSPQTKNWICTVNKADVALVRKLKDVGGHNDKTLQNAQLGGHDDEIWPNVQFGGHDDKKITNAQLGRHGDKTWPNVQFGGHDDKTW